MTRAIKLRSKLWRRTGIDMYIAMASAAIPGGEVNTGSKVANILISPFANPAFAATSMRYIGDKYLEAKNGGVNDYDAIASAVGYGLLSAYLGNFGVAEPIVSILFGD